MQVIEHFTVGKAGPDRIDLNEDGWVFTDDWVAVFDGETDRHDSGSPTPGKRAVQALEHCVRDLDPESDPMSVVQSMHNMVSRVPVESCTRPAAVAALINIKTRQVICVGDIWVGINGSFQITRNLIDELASTVRATYMRGLIEEHGKFAVESLTEDPGRKIVLPILQQSTIWRNNPDSELGFATIDGTATPSEMIEVIELPSDCEVVLATDGYCDPRSTLEESEELLMQSLRCDPLRIGAHAATKPKYPHLCSFDDRTYVRFTL